MKKRLIDSLSWPKILLIVGSIFFALESQAQTLSQHNWYFGNSVNGIRFNRSTNLPSLVTNQAVPFGTGGSAVATDPSNADLLFYSDGDKIYNSFHQQMPKSVTIGTLKGNPSANQPVVFCPVPGQTGKYFVFTNSANYTTGGKIFWNVIDMTLFGGAVFPAPPLGDLENNAMTQIAGLAGTSEGMTIVPNSNGTDHWLIVHENNTANYYALPITAASYPSGIFSPAQGTASGFPTSVANFAYNRKFKLMGVSAQDTRTDAMVMAFDPATGKFDPITAKIISNSGVTTTTNQSIYDMEWDIAGRYLYLSRVGEPGINADVLQFDMLNGTTNQNPNGISLLSVLNGASIFKSWGLILAPDSTIYHLYQAASGGPFLLENFTQTNHRADSVIRNPLPFGAVNFAGTQFPQFTAANPNLTVSFTSMGTCQNNPTSFFPTVSPNADSLHWDFGDGKDTTLWSPNHTYGTPQTYNVKLTAYYQGQQKSFTQPVTINPMQLKIQLVSDTTACRSEFPPPRGSSSPKQFSVKVKVTAGSASSYKWSNGQTTATLKPDSAGYYYVVVTDASSPGCSAYAGVNVKEYKLQDQRSNTWYFGNKAGIDFNKRPPKALSNSAMTAPAGCAIISDRNGQTIFYTDGNNVYRYDEVTKTSSLIDTGIGGDPNSSQSAFIMPVPGDETLYYIFTTQAINGTSANELRYSLFDLKQNNGVGALVQKNVLLFSKSSEHLTGNTNWLIAHEYGNSTFRAYRISASGISDPVYSDIGSVESFGNAASGQGYMKLGPNNNLAVAVSDPGTSNLVDLFTFVDSSGVVTNYRKIDLKQSNGQVYGVEFSPGGNKLFATIKDIPNSTVFEYFIDSIGNPYLRSKPPTTFAAELGALQLGPDGQIYMAVNGSGTLGTIQANEDTTKISSINISGFSLASGTTSTIGLPNLRQQNGNGPGGPGFTFTGICLGDSTKFVGTPTDAIDKFQWFFGDGGGSTNPSPTHLYASTGTFTVRMRLTNRCGLDTTITQKVTIYNPPAKPSLLPAAVICNGALTLDANTPNTPGLTYIWNTGATTKTISVSVPTVVSVTNTDVQGCFSKAQSIIVDNRPQVNLGPDQTVCQNFALANLDAQNPVSTTYAWTVRNITAGLPGTIISTSATQQQTVSTSTPGIFNYQVVVTNTITTCTVTAQKNVTVNVTPSASLNLVTSPSCNPNFDGVFNLKINPTVPTSGPYSYQIYGPAPGTLVKQDVDRVAGATITIINRPGGTYTATVIDQVNGCFIDLNLPLSNAAFSVSALNTTCDPPTVTVSSTAVGPTAYLITLGATTVYQGAPTASPITLPSQGYGTTNSYSIQVTDNGGCVKSITKNVTTISNPGQLTINTQLCDNPATVDVSGGVAGSYTWTLPNGSTSSSNPLTISKGGTYSVTGTSPLPSGCKISASTTFVFNGAIVPNITQTDPCQLSVVASASPSGSFTYQWTAQKTGQISFGSSIPVTATDTYTLIINDTQFGCSTPPFQKQVDVIGTITASLAASLACDDGKPFTLTATVNTSSPTPTPTFSWSLDGSTIAGATTNPLNQTSAGTYQVTVSQGTCQAVTSIQIVRAPLPIGKLPSLDFICPGSPDATKNTKFLDPGVFPTYEWYKNDVMDPSYSNKQVYKATSAGTYRVDLTNDYPCSNSNTIVLQEQCDPFVSAPNAFRPASSEAVNKVFQVFSMFIDSDKFEIVIFNRWGEAVFESTKVDFTWDGGYNAASGGTPLPGGTYAYIVRYVSSYRPEDGVKEKRGGVLLLR